MKLASLAIDPTSTASLEPGAPTIGFPQPFLTYLYVVELHSFWCLNQATMVGTFLLTTCSMLSSPIYSPCFSRVHTSPLTTTTATRLNSRGFGIASSVPRSNSTTSTSDGSIVGFSSLDESQISDEAAAKEKPESFTGCKACGRAEIERGCNGEGRIQGGIGVVPGFGWWPIKAYRPCPAFVEAGGRYRRIGQSLDEVAFGRKGKGDDLDITERFGR